MEAQRTICYAYARSINADIISEYTDIESGNIEDAPTREDFRIAEVKA